MPQIRLIDPYGYTVPGTVYTITDDQVPASKANLLFEGATQDADYWNQFGHRLDIRDYRVHVAGTTPQVAAQLPAA